MKLQLAPAEVIWNSKEKQIFRHIRTRNIEIGGRCRNRGYLEKWKLRATRARTIGQATTRLRENCCDARH